VHALVSWLAVVGGIGLIVVLTLGGTEPPRRVAQAMTAGALGLVLASGWSLLVPAWRRLRSRAAVARALDRAGRFQDALAAADEALAHPERWRADTPVKAELRSRLLARSSRLLGDLALWRLLPVGRPWLVFAVMTSVLAAVAWLGVARPDTLARGSRLAVAAWLQPTEVRGGLQPVAGPRHVLAGDDLTVEVIDLVGDPGAPVVGEVRRGSEAWHALPARQVDLMGVDPSLPDPFERWAVDLLEVREDLEYRFRRGGRASDARRLEVRRPPLITELAARVEPPAYTGLPIEHVPRLPAYMEVPEGSRLVLSGRASSALAAAAVVQDTLALALMTDGAGFEGSLPMSATRRFQLKLTDRRGLEGMGELVHEVVVLVDRPPLVILERPDDDGLVPLAGPLVLNAQAEDDHGLVAVDLLVRRGDAVGGSWVADLPGGGEPSAEDGWERVPLLDRSGDLLSGQRDARLSLGVLPVAAAPRERPDAGVLSARLSLAVHALGLVPGDVLELTLEARDNRQPPPAGVARSAVLRLQVPSSLDLLAARQEDSGQHQAELDGVRQRAGDLGAQLERLRRELLKNPSLDWERRQELEQALQRQQALQNDLERLAEALGQDLEQLAENHLTSPELLEKMDRIEDLLADRQDRSLESLLESLRESLAELSPREMERAMDDLVREQEQLQRRLDAATAMLEDLAREQEMEGLTNLVAQMLEEQQALAEASRQEDRQAGEQDAQDGDDAPDPSASDSEPGDDGGAEGEQSEGEQSEGEQSEGSRPDHEELARRQEALADQLDAMRQQMEDALADLQEQAEEGDLSAAEQQMADALAEALEQMEEQRTGETMQQAGESLQQQQSDQAAQQQQQALTDLAGLYHVMLRSQAAMQMAMKTEQAGQMRDVAADLLALSERQEHLGLDVPVNLRVVRAADLLRRQYDVVQGTVAVRDALADVAPAAPQEILRMLENLDGLIRTQGDVLEQLKEGRGQAARQAASQSLSGMNEVVINLLTQAQQTGEGGGSGQPQPMLSQQLRQMSEEQSGLNALAEQLRRSQGGLSQELRAGMQRLQQGQQGLAGQARQLAEQQRELERSGEGRRILGDLDALGREMEGVGDDLAGGLITPEVLRRQERILSRLLDMHNASRERDWARRREGRTADELFADQDGALGPEASTDDPEARRWRPVEEAPPAYRDLVRRYYREVQRLHEQTGRQDDGRPDERRRGG